MLKFHNTLSRQKEEFVPIHGKRVNMFVCGMSPYDLPHLGHAKTYVTYDVLARYLRFRGYHVFYLQNVTDVEDKIINRALELGVEVRPLVESNFAEYVRDMETLNVTSVNLYAWATEYLPEIFAQVQDLIDKGFAYVANGSVYFEAKRFGDFGKLSGIDIQGHKESLEESGLLEDDEDKRNPEDFALWKAWKPGEPSWDSPWGKGRPGWHIEDTAIAMTHFGGQYDIHGGATELMFPHHEAEIAQAEALTGAKPYVKYWLHAGVLNVEGRKMSKSLGNFMTIRDALKDYDPQVLRYFLVNMHYRSPFDFTREQLGDAEKGYARLLEALFNLREAGKTAEPGRAELGRHLSKAAEGARARFFGAMDDDLNTREAIGALFELAHEANRLLAEGNPGQEALAKALALFEDARHILGIFKERVGGGTERLDSLMALVVRLRESARKRKDFAESDSIRDELGAMGIALEDAKDGVKWKVK